MGWCDGGIGWGELVDSGVLSYGSRDFGGGIFVRMTGSGVFRL